MRRVEVKVIARAKKEEIVRLSENIYRIKVFVPPEKGRANERVIEILSDELGVNKRKVRIVSGLTSNRKIIEVDV